MTDPVIPASAALKGYAEASPATRPADAMRPQSGSNFAELAGGFIDALREAETTVEAGLVGRADPQAVVQALAATEMAVQTAVAVRDRVVEAYQEILRMPV
ncbi:MAG: flagellar hook-basal body complex protein FliE [Pseudomonadota bacterium]